MQPSKTKDYWVIEGGLNAIRFQGAVTLTRERESEARFLRIAIRTLQIDRERLRTALTRNIHNDIVQLICGSIPSKALRMC